MKNRARLFGVAFALAMTALAGPSRADDLEKAKPFFDAGAAAYAAGDFAAASQAFGEAYALAPRPQILFSLAQAERRQHTAKHQPQYLADALTHFRLYVEQVPQGGRRADAVEALAELEAAAARVSPSDGAADSAREVNTRLMVSTPTRDAVVLVDGVSHGESPVIQEVKPGKHHVKVTAPGYFDDERDVTSVKGNLIAVEVTLKDQPAQLVLRAPDGADVTIDGRPYGTTPLAPLELPAGTHAVTLTKMGHRPVLKNVALERGASKQLGVSMKDTTQRTAAYVVLGAAAFSGVAGGVLAGAAAAKQSTAAQVQSDASQHMITAEELGTYNAALSARDRLRGASFVAFGGAGAFAVAGFSLFLFDHPTPQREEAAPVRAAKAAKAALLPIPGGTAVVLRGSF